MASKPEIDELEEVEPTAQNGWGANTIGGDDEDGEVPSGPINPLAAVLASGKYDVDRISDNPNIVPAGRYTAEIRSIKFKAAGEFPLRVNIGKGYQEEFPPHASIKIGFRINDGQQYGKFAMRTLYLPDMENDEKELADFLGDKIKQAYFSMNIPRSEWATLDLQDYVGDDENGNPREYSIQVGVITEGEGEEKIEKLHFVNSFYRRKADS